MRLRSVVVLGGLLLAEVTAHAGTISLGSYLGSASTSFANTAITYTNTMGSGSVVGYQDPSYAAPLSGSQYVSYTSAYNAAVNYTTSYSTMFTGNFAGASGSLSLLADNFASVYLNGALVGSYGSFHTAGTLLLPSTDFVNGTNLLTFAVLNDNTGGPTAFDFAAIVGSTPDPSSMALLGTGLLGVAALMRRRRV